MKYIAQYINNDPADERIDVYPEHGTRPICLIHGEDLYEIMGDSQFERFMEKGDSLLRLPINRVKEKALLIYD